MASPLPLELPSGFKRRLFQEGARILIESTCTTCGQIIVGTMMGFPSLTEIELAHCTECKQSNVLPFPNLPNS